MIKISYLIIYIYFYRNFCLLSCPPGRLTPTILGQQPTNTTRRLCQNVISPSLPLKILQRAALELLHSEFWLWLPSGSRESWSVYVPGPGISISFYANSTNDSDTTEKGEDWHQMQQEEHKYFLYLKIRAVACIWRIIIHP